MDTYQIFEYIFLLTTSSNQFWNCKSWIFTNVFPRLYFYFSSKALTKSEGPNVCWDAPFYESFFLNFNQLPAAKKGLKNSESNFLGFSSKNLWRLCAEMSVSLQRGIASNLRRQRRLFSAKIMNAIYLASSHKSFNYWYLTFSIHFKFITYEQV